MKIRNAILFQVLIVALFSIVVTGFTIILLNFNFYVKEEINTLFREAENLSNNIRENYLSDLDYEKQSEKVLFEILKSELVNKLNFFNKWGIHFDLFQKNSVLFSQKDNLEFLEEVQKAIEGKKAYIIRTDNNQTILSIAMPLFNDDNQMILIMDKDITTAKISRNKQYFYLLVFLLIAFIVLIPITFYFSSLITNPIIKLINQMKDFKNQRELSKPLPLKIYEIDQLQRHFHNMSFDINNQISTLISESESKELFLGKLNHELNTPITAIKGFADLLLHTKYDKELYSKALTHIHNESIRITNLNSNLQNLLLPAIDHRWEIIDLELILDDVWLSLKYLWDDKKLEIINNTEYPKIKGDPGLIFTALKNILHNSIKATNKSEEIIISSICSEKSFCLKIKDFGIGIEYSDLLKVKEPYFQGKRQINNNEGSGLGLSICDEVMSYHNCSWEIKSGLEKGTIVFLDFTNILHSL